MVLKAVLAASPPRPTPTDGRTEKNNYAVTFADRIGMEFASDLRNRLPGIVASATRAAGAVAGKKQLDINFSTPEIGLGLGISLKSVHIREASGGQRYTHNMKRNEEELRIEAAGYHKRQPYAVMVGVLFLPFDSCTDARTNNTSSSFGSWVRHLRPYTQRTGPQDELDKLEKIFIALYDPTGERMKFFDVQSDPPKNACPSEDGELHGIDGRPRRLLTYEEFLDAVYHGYLRRNSLEFNWADGSEDPHDADDAI